MSRSDAGTRASAGGGSFEVNFAYAEEGEQKNALVKLRCCPECAYMLNYKSIKRKERKDARLERKRRKVGAVPFVGEAHCNTAMHNAAVFPAGSARRAFRSGSGGAASGSGSATKVCAPSRRFRRGRTRRALAV
jgi:hypothetical protein